MRNISTKLFGPEVQNKLFKDVSNFICGGHLKPFVKCGRSASWGTFL